MRDPGWPAGTLRGTISIRGPLGRGERDLGAGWRVLQARILAGPSPAILGASIASNDRPIRVVTTTLMENKFCLYCLYYFPADTKSRAAMVEATLTDCSRLPDLLSSVFAVERVCAGWIRKQACS